MDHSHIMAFGLARLVGDGTSALPGAPVIAEPAQQKPRMLRLRGRFASLLHRMAWAVEPRYFNN
jgi:hypothetical protein